MSLEHKITFTESDDGSIRIALHLDDDAVGVSGLAALAIHGVAIGVDMEMLHDLIPDNEEEAAKIHNTVRTLRK